MINTCQKIPLNLFNVIVTQSMEKLLGKGSAIGKTMERQTNNGTFNLIVTGVVKDYVYGDMYGESAPVIFYYIPQAANLMYVRIKANSDAETCIGKNRSSHEER